MSASDHRDRHVMRTFKLALLGLVWLLGLLGTGNAFAQAQGDSQRLAAVLARLQQLEEEVRTLRGRVEELEHAQTQSDARFDDLLAGVDARLAEVEPPGSSAGSYSAGRAPAVGGFASGQGAARTGSTPGADELQPDLAAQRGNILGTIPRGALMGEAGSARSDGIPPAARQADAPRTAETVALLTRATEGDSADARYDATMGLLRGSDWNAAQTALAQFVEDFPNDQRAATAAYWLGETHYVQQDFEGAAASFAKNYRTYGPDSSRAPDTLLKLGMSLAKLGDRQRACQTFNELAKRHPNATAAVRQSLARERAATGCG
jgi:tol-pal system protein YbgF